MAFNTPTFHVTPVGDVVPFNVTEMSRVNVLEKLCDQVVNLSNENTIVEGEKLDEWKRAVHETDRTLMAMVPENEEWTVSAAKVYRHPFPQIVWQGNNPESWVLAFSPKRLQDHRVLWYSQRFSTHQNKWILRDSIGTCWGDELQEVAELLFGNVTDPERWSAFRSKASVVAVRYAPTEIAELFAEQLLGKTSESVWELCELASRNDLNPQLFERFASTEDFRVRVALVENPTCPWETAKLTIAHQRVEPPVFRALLGRVDCPEEFIMEAAMHSNRAIREVVLSNEQIPSRIRALAAL